LWSIVYVTSLQTAVLSVDKSVSEAVICRRRVEGVRRVATKANARCSGVDSNLQRVIIIHYVYPGSQLIAASVRASKSRIDACIVIRGSAKDITCLKTSLFTDL